MHFSLFVQFNLSLTMRISHKGIFWNLKVLHDYISGMYSIIVISTIIFQNKFLYKQQMFKRVYVPLYLLFEVIYKKMIMFPNIRVKMLYVLHSTQT